MARVLMWLIGLPLLIILVAAILINVLLDEERLVALASDQLEQETGAVLRVDGSASLSLFPKLGVQLEQASLDLPEDEGGAIEIGTLVVGVELIPLLSGQVRVDELRLEGLRVAVTSAPAEPKTDTSGFSDAQLEAFYEARRKAREAAGADRTAAVMAAPLALNVKRLLIRDARIEQTDADSGEVTVIELERLESNDLNLDGSTIPIESELRISAPDRAPIALQLDGAIRVDQEQQMVHLEGIDVRVEGALPEPVRIRASGDFDGLRQIAQLELGLDLGDGHGEGSLRFAQSESPQIDADLHFDQLDPALFALAGPDAAQQPDKDDDSGEDSGDQPLPLDALRAIDTRATLAIDRAVFEGHTIEQLEAKVRAVDGSIKLLYARGRLHGGQLEAKAHLNAGKSTARLDTQGSLKGLEIPAALEAAQQQPLMEGRADLEWQVSSAGNTSNALVENLNGPISLVASDALLKDIGVEKMLCQAVALANQQALTAALPQDTAFETLSLKLKLEDGKLKLSPLQATLPHTSLRGEGRLHLDDQTFSGKFAARLSPALVELDPACRVNERLTAIDWPVICEGELAGEPGDWCRVDSDKILTDLTTNEAKRKLEKEAGKLLDKLLNKR